MSKKILMSLAPLLVVSAFAVMPAMASARLSYGTETGGVFTPFASSTKVVTKGTTAYKLTASGETIECKTLADHGTVKNEGTPSVGHSEETLEFGECMVTTGTFKGCKVASAGFADINGTITDVVTSEQTVEITVTGGFVITFTGSPAGCPAAGTELGTVTGHATGVQLRKTNKLEFSESTGLKFLGEEAFITGTDESNTEVGAKPVVI